MDYQSNNLVVPRGSILFNAFVPGTLAGRGYKQLGNCPEFTLTRGTQDLVHRSSQIGYRTRDARLMIDDDLSGSLVTDDIKVDNLRLWFMSPTVETITTASATAQTETLVGVLKGATYQIGRTAINPTGLRNVTVTTVTPSGGGGALVENTDYIVDQANGLLELLPGGSAVDASTLTVAYSVGASTFERVIAATHEVEGEILFLSNNPHGAQSRIWIPRATITPNGDMSLMTDPDSPTWQTLQLTITALKLNALAMAYRDGVPAIA